MDLRYWHKNMANKRKNILVLLYWPKKWKFKINTKNAHGQEMNLRPLKPTPTNQTIALVTAFYLFYSYAFYLFYIYKLKLVIQ